MRAEARSEGAATRGGEGNREGGGAEGGHRGGGEETDFGCADLAGKFGVSGDSDSPGLKGGVRYGVLRGRSDSRASCLTLLSLMAMGEGWTESELRVNASCAGGFRFGGKRR